MDDNTISPNVKPRIQYVASQDQTEFFFPFAVFKDADIVVFEDADRKFLYTDYVVQIDQESSTGSIVFNSGRSANRIITIVRNVSIERVSDFQSSGYFKAETLNAELDFQVAALQDLTSDRDRSVRLAAHDEDADLVLPPRQARAGKWPNFDADGNLIVSDPPSGGVGTGGGATDHGALTGLGDDDHLQYHTDARGDARYYTRSQVDTALGGKSNTSHDHDGDYVPAIHLGDTSNPHSVTAVQVGAPPVTRSVGTRYSLTGGGDLGTDRVINLVNDESSPGANKVYGTDVAGVRRWKNDPSGGVTDHGALTGLGDDDHAQYHTDARGDARYYTHAQIDTALAGKSDTSHSHDNTYAAASHVGDTGNPHAVTAAQVGAAPAGLVIEARYSLTGGGDLSANRAFNLVNDEPSPGANMVYGTDGAGMRRWKNDPSGGAGGGVTNHAALTGLADDDHAQYHTDARGDARYYTHAQIDTALAGKSDTSHSHDGTYAAASHVDDTGNPHAVTKAQVGLGNVPDLKVNLASSVDPCSTDDADSGYAVGSRWINNSNGTEWVCVDAAAAGAQWIKTTNTAGTGGAPAGTGGSVQYNAGGSLGADGPFTYDEDNNILVVDQEVRDATYPFNSADISGGTADCPFGYKQIARLTVTGDITGALALPTQVKEVTNSNYGASSSYFALRQLIIRQDQTGGHKLPENFWDNYVLSGTPPPLPTAPGALQEYLLIGEWDGAAWLCWKVLGENNAFAPFVAAHSPAELTKSNNEVLCLSGAGVLNLPPASGDGQAVTIVNRSGGVVTLAPAGSDTIGEGAITIDNLDTIALIDYPVGSAAWMRL
ncbi:MAG: hypothetical protein IPM60_04765 [Rhodospirillales bacterium]|nr:hypothetical protein [Rhodospirillales bacterium]